MMPLLLLLAATGLAAGAILGRKFPRLWLWLTVVAAGALFSAAAAVLVFGGDWEWRPALSLAGEPLHLRLDALSALFLLLVGVVGGAGAVYSAEYWSDKEKPESAPRGRAWWSGFVLSLVGVLVSSNGLHFLIAWEAFTVCAFFLVTLDRQIPEVRAAGWLYLAASHVGTVCLFAFFGTLAAKTGSWDLGPMNEQLALAPLFWLALVGFGVKAGVFPLHVWLPSAHANAPSHVSAILSGVAVKMGVYGIIRFSGWMALPASAGYAILAAGAVSALLGISFALAQNDMKRLLAYCSVENIGVIFMGIGAALLGVSHGGASWGRLALAGALLHVLNHGLFKSLLFLGAGSVLHATGTREMSRLGGLWRRMPWTAGLFAFGAAAISGLPPFNGFVSEWLVYLGLFDTVNVHGSEAGAAAAAVIVLAVTGALALASFVKACGTIFLGLARTPDVERAHECGTGMRGPMVFLAALCLLVGVAPVLLWGPLCRAAEVWNPAWAGNDTVPSSLAALGVAQAALALVFIGGGAWFVKRVFKRDLKRGVTWDCGYARPTARMQYTGGSFSGAVVEWFQWILRPQGERDLPQGLLPKTATATERVPETVLECLLGPVSVLVMRVSTSVRKLQQGRLQSYILYLLVGLAAVAVLAVLGGMK